MINGLKPWCRGVPSALCSKWHAMSVCDAIIVSTISRMLRTVAAVVNIILNIRCWSWARLCCVWKLPNFFKRPVSVLKNTTAWKCRKIRITICEEQILSGIGEDPDKPNIFIKKNVRNHSYHQFYPVLAKIRINQGLLYVDTVATRKDRAACAQSFALWQQATIEFTCHDHSIVACSRHVYILLFFAHIPFVVNHTINATPPERLQQHPLLFTTNRTDRTFFLWRLHTARPPHPGHNTILLRSEKPERHARKALHCGNNRVHMPWSLYYCLLAPCIYIVVLRAHPVRGELHNQRNIIGEVATILPNLWNKLTHILITFISQRNSANCGCYSNG